MNTKLAKLNASSAADEALDRMLIRVNEGFAGGKVTKTQLTSWIILGFEKSYIEKSLLSIREDHFDEVSYLESVVATLKRSKKEGHPHADIDSMLSRFRVPKATKRLKTLVTGQRADSKKDPSTSDK